MIANFEDYFNSLQALIDAAPENLEAKLSELISHVYEQHGWETVFTPNTNDHNKNIFHYLALCNPKILANLLENLDDVMQRLDFNPLMQKSKFEHTPMEYAVISNRNENALTYFKFMYNKNSACFRLILDFITTSDGNTLGPNREMVMPRYAKFLRAVVLFFLANFPQLKSDSIDLFYQLVILLVQRDFLNLATVDSDDFPILHQLILLAISNDASHVISILFYEIEKTEYKQQLTVCNRNGDNALLLAMVSISRTSTLAVLEILLKYFRTDIQNFYGSNILHKLFRSKHSDFIMKILEKLIIKIPADEFKFLLRQQDLHGKTPLADAIEFLPQRHDRYISAMIEVIQRIVDIYPEIRTIPLTKQNNNLLWLVQSRQQLYSLINIVTPISIDVTAHHEVQMPKKRRVVIYDSSNPAKKSRFLENENTPPRGPEKLAETKKQLQAKQEANNKLLQDRIKTFQDKNIGLTQQLKTQLEKFQKSHAEYRAEFDFKLAGYEKEIVELKNRNTSMQAEKEGQLLKLEDLESELVQQHKAVEKLGTQFRGLSQEAEKNTAEFEKMQNQLQAATAEIVDLKKEVTASTIENASLTSKLKMLEAGNSGLIAQAHTFQEGYFALHAYLEPMEQQKKDLMLQIFTVQQQAMERENKLSSELEAIKKENAELKKQLGTETQQSDVHLQVISTQRSDQKKPDEGNLLLNLSFLCEDLCKTQKTVLQKKTSTEMSAVPKEGAGKQKRGSGNGPQNLGVFATTANLQSGSTVNDKPAGKGKGKGKHLQPK